MPVSPSTTRLIYAREVDSESRAAAGLLATLTRVARVLADIHHPFARSTPFSYFLPPGGARAGTRFTLPDGREVSFEVTITSDERGFRVLGRGEEELPPASTPDIHDALSTLDDYADRLARSAVRILDRLLDDIV